MSKPIPNTDYETAFNSRGYTLIAGVDEAGRGALAGPVVASAVILPGNAPYPWLADVRDSKQLTPKKREELAPLIQDAAIAWSTGIVPPEVIDMIGIAAATFDAMRQAVKQLSRRPEYVLVDYFTIPRLGIPQKGVVNGDDSCLSIACASIIAKVTRDRIMCELDGDYPGYGFTRHKGYGTAGHLECLQKFGPCRIHRTSFAHVLGDEYE
ncbi:MAG: ribonuclease HII [Chloroflexota bacterium]